MELFLPFLNLTVRDPFFLQRLGSLLVLPRGLLAETGGRGGPIPEIHVPLEKLEDTLELIFPLCQILHFRQDTLGHLLANREKDLGPYTGE